MLEKAGRTRTIFARRSLRPEEVKPEWERQAAQIGTHVDVQRFVESTCRFLSTPLAPAGHSDLIAGHAKPWVDSTPAQRIAPYNGLPPEARFDRLFDQGLITSADDGGIILSRSLNTAQCRALGLSPALHLHAPLHALHLPDLRYHRRHVFQGCPRFPAVRGEETKQVGRE